MNQVELTDVDLSPAAVRGHVARGRAERARMIRGFALGLVRALGRRRAEFTPQKARMAGMNA